MANDNVTVSVQEILALLGDKEVQLSVERGRVAKAQEIVKLQQAKISELEAKLIDKGE